MREMRGRNNKHQFPLPEGAGIRGSPVPFLELLITFIYIVEN
jgi:hypothetical protein